LPGTAGAGAGAGSASGFGAGSTGGAFATSASGGGGAGGGVFSSGFGSGRISGFGAGAALGSGAGFGGSISGFFSGACGGGTGFGFTTASRGGGGSAGFAFPPDRAKPRRPIRATTISPPPTHSGRRDSSSAFTTGIFRVLVESGIREELFGTSEWGADDTARQFEQYDLLSMVEALPWAKSSSRMALPQVAQ
jgi:hypothetical protein